MPSAIFDAAAYLLVDATLLTRAALRHFAAPLP